MTTNEGNIAANTAAIGSTSDGTYVKAANSVGENLNALDTQVAALAGGTGAGLDAVNHRISNLDSRVNKVGAGADALAALHPIDMDGEFAVAAGFGNYRNANAMALGMFYRPQDNVMVSLGGAVGNGENMVNMGITFALDKLQNPGIRTSKAAMARKIAAQDEEIAALKEAHAKENAENKAEIQALKEALARLEAKVAK